MRALALLLATLSLPALGAPPTLEEVRRGMGISSTDALRGQADTVGFASTAAQMKAVWELAASAPAPPAPAGKAPTIGPGVAAVICPHDDYLYAGRIYRRIVPLVTAKTVVMVGVFHRYRAFEARDALAFDPYPAWRSPDGPIAVSALREEVFRALSPEDRLQSAAMHDSEHSLEAIAYWLKHQNASVEIVPVIVPAMSLPRMEALAARFGDALAAAMKVRGWVLGRDVAIVISTDGVHYGADFRHVPFGEGGIDAYAKATARDEELLAGSLAGPIETDRVRSLYATFVDPESPDTYRLTWCGRFSVPFGLLALARVAEGTGRAVPVGVPLAYATSVGSPELPVRDLGMGETAPANLYHFVGYPAAAYSAGSSSSAAELMQ